MSWSDKKLYEKKKFEEIHASRQKISEFIDMWSCVSSRFTTRTYNSRKTPNAY